MLRHSMRLGNRAMLNRALVGSVGGAAAAALYERRNDTSFSSVLCRRRVYCDDGKKAAGGFDPQAFLGQLKVPEWIDAEHLKPLGGGFSFGGICGFSAGMACKKIGKAVAIGVGGLFCLFQTAAHFDYIKINWAKVEKDAMGTLDTNGDGKIDEKDGAVWMGKVLQILSTDELAGKAAKNATSGGFAAAFLLGFKKG